MPRPAPFDFPDLFVGALISELLPEGLQSAGLQIKRHREDDERPTVWWEHQDGVTLLLLKRALNREAGPDSLSCDIAIVGFALAECVVERKPGSSFRSRLGALAGRVGACHPSLSGVASTIQELARESSRAAAPDLWRELSTVAGIDWVEWLLRSAGLGADRAVGSPLIDMTRRMVAWCGEAHERRVILIKSLRGAFHFSPDDGAEVRAARTGVAQLAHFLLGVFGEEQELTRKWVVALAGVALQVIWAQRLTTIAPSSDPAPTLGLKTGATFHSPSIMLNAIRGDPALDHEVQAMVVDVLRETPSGAAYQRFVDRLRRCCVRFSVPGIGLARERRSNAGRRADPNAGRQKLAAKLRDASRLYSIEDAKRLVEEAGIKLENVSSALDWIVKKYPAAVARGRDADDVVVYGPRKLFTDLDLKTD